MGIDGPADAQHCRIYVGQGQSKELLEVNGQCSAARAKLQQVRRRLLIAGG